jgi:hypothetical protein
MKPNEIVLESILLAAIAWLSFSCAACAVRAAELQPREFAVDKLPAVAPAFSPDGKTVFFGRSVGKAIFIFVSQRSGDTWGPAKPAPFSGTYRDLEPTFDPNGKYLIFASNRPLAGVGGSAAAAGQHQRERIGVQSEHHGRRESVLHAAGARRRQISLPGLLFGELRLKGANTSLELHSNELLRRVEPGSGKYSLCQSISRTGRCKAAMKATSRTNAPAPANMPGRFH